MQKIDPTVRFWAPTRTHVLKWGTQFWASRDEDGNSVVPSNFIIRPSAYHLGDPAPRVQGIAKGTSVLSEKDTLEELAKGNRTSTSDGSRFDWQCGVYALGKGDKTCVHALAPDAKPGCRVCWSDPDLAVNYVAH